MVERKAEAAPLVLVTGAGGFVGSFLVNRLADAGAYRVRTLSRQLNTTMPATVQQRVYEAPFDPANLEASIDGVDTVVHCAGRAHVMDESGEGTLAAYQKVNVEYSLNLAKAALKAGVRRFVYLSSIKVNGESTDGRAPFHPLDAAQPEDVYGESKWEAEQALGKLLEGRCELVVVRPPLVYGAGVKGNFARLEAALMSRKPLPVGCLKNVRSLVSLPNLVDFLQCCLSHPNAAGKVFIPSDQHDLSVRDMVCEMALAKGVKPIMLPVPVWCLKALGVVFGRQAAVARLCGTLRVDHTHTREWLGWSAPYKPFAKLSGR
ncbi:NAD-dependent epimerase/dehydratase family protein [Marinobacter hydrocarbonoclasticus]|uniref:NAD-dependent epimerase/dehydratase family protein n=1 Tax=Marinobacter nauticus TaxID=2743 RepID=UPI001C9715C4|nr:NAD-dependent epimerase/dehydratase family protein [Marinobacter nauticus]MBY6192906.1 NAD-dependent epimerase/dehydratase family protein [Marinobacter nauticus]MBY6214054.1 NAD-dependent epimerase/dehydratase family protein [Marinobacter nauticus]